MRNIIIIEYKAAVVPAELLIVQRQTRGQVLIAGSRYDLNSERTEIIA